MTARVLRFRAEHVVRRPGAAATIVQAAAGLGRVVLGGAGSSPGTADPRPDEGKIRHIHVS